MSNKWHQYLTIDLLARVAERSLFHPFIAWLIPLCLRAQAASYTSTAFVATSAYAVFVTLVAILGVSNKRIAYGLPRELDWDEEVVVITGGANGLGKIIAQMYGMRGASVAVLDVKSPDKDDEGSAGIHFYQCDVGGAQAVEKAKAQIEQDVCRCLSTIKLITTALRETDCSALHSSALLPS